MLANCPEFLHLILENPTRAIAIFDRQMRYLGTNQRWVEAFNLAGTDRIGQFPEFTSLNSSLEQTLRACCLTGIIQDIPLGWKISPWHQSTGDVGGMVVFSEMTQCSEASHLQSEHRLSLLFQQTPLAVMEVDLNGKFIAWNPAAERIFGYSYQEAIGQSFEIVVLEQMQEYVFQILKDLLQQKQGSRSTNESRTKSGKTIICEWYNFPLINAQGKAIGTVHIAEDISDRKQMEKALLESQQMLQLVMDNIPQAIFWKDCNLVYMGSNRSHALDAGLASPDEVVGKTDYDLPWTKEQSDFYRESDRRIMSQNAPEYHLIEPQLQADGKLAWIDTTKIPLHDAEGNVVGILGTYEDITDRKQAESALQQSETRLRELLAREQLLNRLSHQIRSSLDLQTILKTAVQEIYSLLQVERCLFIWYKLDQTPSWEVVQEAKNPSLTSRLGIRSSLTAVDWKVLEQQILRVDDVQALSDPVEQEFLTNCGYRAVLALTVRPQSGAVGLMVCSHSSEPRRWSESEVELLRSVGDSLEIAIDQADLYKQSRTAAATAEAKTRELEQTLKKLKSAQLQLVQSEKMSSLGQLVAGVAHEINNPVNFIYGNLIHALDYTSGLLNLIDLYGKYYPNPVSEIQEEIEAIDLEFLVSDLPNLLTSMQVGADRIREIVLSLRNFSRLDEAEMKSVDVHEGINNTLLILQSRVKPRADHPAIEIVKEFGNLPLVNCYAGQLNQVFMNLIINAIDAIDEQNYNQSNDVNARWIRIRTMVKEKRIQIAIADSGGGMSAEVKQRLFDPFFTTKPVGSGTGLGLAISYQIIVEKHQGKLKVNSELGKGAEFIIEIPI